MDNKEVYEKFDWSSLKHEHLADKIKKVIDTIPNEVGSIIDIGCGNGVITNVLGKSFDVTAVDRSIEALKFVETKKINASADNIPVDSNAFDMVFSSELLEHLEEDVFNKTILEFKRISKEYILITVPNNENPDKLSIRCPECKYIFNSPSHLRSFKKDDFNKLFPEYQIVKTFTYGKKVRYYNKVIRHLKIHTTPSSSWIPYYWISKDKRNKSCPSCEHSFHYNYKFNVLATSFDIINAIISPKKPYWLFVLMKKK